jgi:transcriptional regulator with XRE-family HTH domain
MKIMNETHQRKKFLLLLKEIRQKRGIRQTELAKQLDVPQSFISKYEAGDRHLDILELRQICQIIGISLDEFIHQMEEKFNEAE